MTRLADEERQVAKAWREAIIAERNLAPELSHLLDGAPGTKTALRLLGDCDELDSLYELMDLCIRLEESHRSQGWRIAWTQAVEEAIARTLAAQHGITEGTAANAFWTAAAGFARRVAEDPAFDGSSLPPQGVNIGWIVGTGPAAAARDALIVVAMEAILVLSEDQS